MKVSLLTAIVGCALATLVSAQDDGVYALSENLDDSRELMSEVDDASEGRELSFDLDDDRELDEDEDDSSNGRALRRRRRSYRKSKWGARCKSSVRYYGLLGKEDWSMKCSFSKRLYYGSGKYNIVNKPATRIGYKTDSLTVVRNVCPHLKRRRKTKKLAKKVVFKLLKNGKISRRVTALCPRGPLTDRPTSTPAPTHKPTTPKPTQKPTHKPTTPKPTQKPTHTPTKQPTKDCRRKGNCTIYSWIFNLPNCNTCCHGKIFVWKKFWEGYVCRQEEL